MLPSSNKVTLERVTRTLSSAVQRTMVSMSHCCATYNGQHVTLLCNVQWSACHTAVQRTMVNMSHCCTTYNGQHVTADSREKQMPIVSYNYGWEDREWMKDGKENRGSHPQTWADIIPLKNEYLVMTHDFIVSVPRNHNVSLNIRRECLSINLLIFFFKY